MQQDNLLPLELCETEATTVSFRNWPANALIQRVDAMKDAVLVVDSHGVVTYTNAGFHQHTGYALHQVVGQQVPLLDRRIANQFRQLSRSWLRRLQRRGKWRGNLNILQANGQHEPAQVQIVPVLTHYKRKFLVVIQRPQTAVGIHPRQT